MSGLTGMLRRNPSLTNSKLSTQRLATDCDYISLPATDEAMQKADGSPKFPVTLYDAIEPNASGLLPVGDGHQIYWEECGNPSGPAAVFLHGGPGGGCSPRSRRFFDPSYYRIVCLDQRGCGRSHPNAADDWEASIFQNNTEKLVGDLEKLREFLKVEQWNLVVGGSWGSTLALAYAEAHPRSMENIVLRGVFLFSPDEVDYLFQNGGTAGQNPEAWELFTKFIEDTSDNYAAERTNYLGAYFKRLQGNADMRIKAASAFVGYEVSATGARAKRSEASASKELEIY
jgi:proline iminopeptidase